MQELGIIIFGHSRKTLLRNVLESLRRQGIKQDIHVWLDGHFGRTHLKSLVEECHVMVVRDYPEVFLTAMNGNLGIEKLMIDGLYFMADRYNKIIVLEDDCFPIDGAIEEFEKKLNEVAGRSDVYSVYGHHFLTEQEGSVSTRFQGWGWATTREKLLPILAEIKMLFLKSEPEYKEWVCAHLTPEVVKRLDVTPGRNCVPVIQRFLCWDGCTCMLTAMRGFVHVRTDRRVVYNCGMGSGSTHFEENSKYRLPPFNMILADEVWDYFDTYTDTALGHDDGSVALMQQCVTKTKGLKTVMMKERVVNDLLFTNIQRTKHGNNSVGYHDHYVIKIEHEKHPLKLRALSEEIEIMRYLNAKGCKSCPKIFADGYLETGEQYFIQERIRYSTGMTLADKIFSILEQKSLGVCQADLKEENFIFNDHGVACIIDYDQAVYADDIKSMENKQFLEWFSRYFVERWCAYGDPDVYRLLGTTREKVFELFEDDAFRLEETTLFKKQITTDSKSGIYHTIRNAKLYLAGVRDLDPRIEILNTIPFSRGERVLDVGCNTGLLTHYLYKQGCEATGIDMDEKIIVAAKMVANIMGIQVDFQHLDLDEKKIEDYYDTICLFSVIHHVRNFDAVTKNICQCCNRVIIESKLVEHGCKAENGVWQNTTMWAFKTKEELIAYYESVFKGFKCDKYYGKGDREREIFSLIKCVK